MKLTRRTTLATALAAGLGGAALAWKMLTRPSLAEVKARLAGELPRPNHALSVFHLGHSLVNRDMPAMLSQIAPPGHRYHSQLGWGTTLKAHWGDAEIAGLETESAHPRFRAAHEAVASGDYDAVILTEMVELRDALRYFDSPMYLAQWVKKATASRPDVRLYVYETWHGLDDPEGWLERIDRDLDRYWLSGVIGPALGQIPTSAQLHLIPAGQVLAAFVRAVEAQGGIGNVKDRTDLFARNPDGGVDQIHLNDLGNYLVALVHFAVLYHRDPVGLPFALLRGDGTAANSPTEEVAHLMQTVTASIVGSSGFTGVAT